jgi:aryl-alcohol dehydrogenase-like predicted oxidoreductase
VRAIGISVPDEGASDANVHIATGHIDVIQTVYNVFQQEPEYTLFPICLEHEVGIIARSPFSSGAISQKWEKNHCFEEGDWRGLWPLEVKPGWLEDQASMGSVIQSLFDEHKVSWTTGALKYVLNSHAVSCVIPGSANPDHVKTNISVSDKSDISSELKSEIKKLWLDRTIHGTYNGSV